jgi:hypothetical protein
MLLARYQTRRKRRVMGGGGGRESGRQGILVLTYSTRLQTLIVKIKKVSNLAEDSE